MNRPRAFNHAEFMNCPGKTLRHGDSREGRRSETTGVDVYVSAQIIGIGFVIVGAALCGTAAWMKRSRKSPAGLLGSKKKTKAYVYTEKDRAMLKLICELSDIYDNTERYLNS